MVALARHSIIELVFWAKYAVMVTDGYEYGFFHWEYKIEKFFGIILFVYYK